MEIGPFNIRDLENLKELFEKQGVDFSILVDQEAQEKIKKEFDEYANFSPYTMAGRLDLKVIYFEISESDFDKVKNQLEKYGVLLQSDGYYELGDE